MPVKTVVYEDGKLQIVEVEDPSKEENSPICQDAEQDSVSGNA